jgi:hypothetical protein
VDSPRLEFAAGTIDLVGDFIQLRPHSPDLLGANKGMRKANTSYLRTVLLWSRDSGSQVDRTDLARI